MKLRQALDEKKFDSRIRDRLLSEGKLTKEELQKYLGSLEDDLEKADIPEQETVAKTLNS